MNLTPNFHFAGDCEQAIRFYKKAFGAEILIFLRNRDADPADFDVPDESRDLVYHAEMLIGGNRIILSDSREKSAAPRNSLSLVVTFDRAQDVREAFSVLQEGATIIHAMKTTTYSSCFVSLIDKFGIRWELMTEQTEP